jgi:hypothetical protein
MRPRCRSLAAGAALAGASTALWASAAGAGESYDEFNHIKQVVNVGGVDCEVATTSYRQGLLVYASTYMQTPDAACATTRVDVGLEFLTEHGDRVTSASLDDGPISVVSANGAVDLVRSTHGVTFASGPSVSYTLNSK